MENLLFTKEHEWANIAGEFATIGITDYAQGELGDIVFIDLPTIGKKVNVGDPVMTIEAVKAVSDVYAPISGEVVEVNDLLNTAPDTINRDPFGSGWMFKIKIAKQDDAKKLLSFEDYKKLIGEA